MNLALVNHHGNGAWTPSPEGLRPVYTNKKYLSYTVVHVLQQQVVAAIRNAGAAASAQSYPRNQVLLEGDHFRVQPSLLVPSTYNGSLLSEFADDRVSSAERIDTYTIIQTVLANSSNFRKRKRKLGVNDGKSKKKRGFGKSAAHLPQTIYIYTAYAI